MGLVLAGEVLGAMIIASGFAGFGFGALLGRASANLGSPVCANAHADDAQSVDSLSSDLSAALLSNSSNSAVQAENTFNIARHRRTVFANMPPVEQVHKQARQIARDEPAWSDPDKIDQRDPFMLQPDDAQASLISQYRRSIAALNDSETRAVADVMDDLLCPDSEHPYSRDISRLKLSA